MSAYLGLQRPPMADTVEILLLLLVVDVGDVGVVEHLPAARHADHSGARAGVLRLRVADQVVTVIHTQAAKTFKDADHGISTNGSGRKI